MAANADPIYCRKGHIGWGALITAANTAYDGTGTVTTVFTADATNGSFVQRIRFRAAGTNVATVARIFINNGSTNATAANNILWDEVALAALIGSQTSATTTYEAILGFVLPPGYVINVTLGTAVAAGYYATVIGGDY